MLKNGWKIISIIIIIIITQILVYLLYPITGDDIAILSLFPSLLVAWFWGPLFGFVGAILLAVLYSLNLFAMGLELNDALENIVGLSISVFLSVGFGYVSQVLNRNKNLSNELSKKSTELTHALEEKNNTEKILRQRLEFISFINKISSEFVNVPSQLIENRIDSAIKQIINLLNADSCCIYTYKEESKSYFLFKEYFGSNNHNTTPHIFQIKQDLLAELQETLLTLPIIVIDKKIWAHISFDLFQTDNVVLLPILNNNKLTGFTFFEKNESVNDWHIQFNDIFQLVKQVIFSALERHFAEEKIISQFEELKKYSESLFKSNVKLNNLNDTLIKTSDALKESESRFRELSENIEDIIWLQHGKEILYVNQAYERILGKKRVDLYKHTLDFIDRIHPEDRDQLLRSFSSHNYEKQGMFRGEFRMIGRNGDLKYFEARAFLIRMDNSRLKIAGIAEDISLKKKAEKEIKGALFKALELNQLKTKFITTVSHQLRTPLANILSSIELLKVYGLEMESDEKSKHYERIISSVDYLTTVLDNVIVVDQSESGIVVPSFSKLNLIEFMNDSIHYIKENIRSDANIILDTNNDIIEIKTDKKLLAQIVDNLLLNAIKFSLPKSPIEISIESRISSFIIKITDKGIGIPYNEQDEIFVPFYRAANAQNIQGTGLGLSIARRWTTILGGTITFYSVLDKGTTFILELPVDSEKDGSKDSINIRKESEYNFSPLL